MELMNFRENNERNNRVVQQALREIDSQMLAFMLFPLGEDERGIVYRNMSKRACSVLAEIVGELEDVPEKTARTALEFFEGKLEKYDRFLRREKDKPAVLTGLDDSTPGSIAESMVMLARYVRGRRTLDLEHLSDGIRNPVLKKGLQIFLDGYDPLIARSILDTQKKAWLRQQEIMCDMIVEGFDSIYQKDFPQVTEDKMRAHLVPVDV